ncbi:hypothetical protein PAXINDRAFT_166981 [Paxillus involutus ATCC 200175]|nr:hypothetical protein PAXINDRAFT_166981 [Paxillus involutus ATCC 200175]
MDDFQFIIESPQAAQSQKKRPRLVTSCDNCRLKKIKCLQSSPETQCEACKLAKIPCKFRDRERYFAERSRAIAGPSSVVTSQTRSDARVAFSSQESIARGESSARGSSSGQDIACGGPSTASQHSQRPSASRYSPPSGGHDHESHVRYQTYPPGHARSAAPHSAHRSNSSSSSHAYERQHSQSPQYRPPQLFDPAQPQSPQRPWMQEFIQLFISNMGTQCPFLTYDDIYDKFRRQTLSPLLANCIAALGARFSDIPEVVARGSQVVVDTYCDNAKELLSTSLLQPTIETVQATILLAWVEYKSSRGQGFRQYCDLAMRTAMAIGLSEQSSFQLSPYDPYQNRLRVTWSSLTHLQLYASSLTT